MTTEFIDVVRAIMIDRCITNTQLGELSGVNKGNLSNAFNHNKVPFKVFYKIAHTLNLTVEEYLPSYFLARINSKRTAWRFTKTAFEDCLKLSEYNLAITVINLYLDSEDVYIHLTHVFELIDRFYKKFPQFRKDLLPIYLKLSQLHNKTKAENDIILSVINYRIIIIRISNGDILSGEVTYWLNYVLTSNMPLKMRLNVLFELCRLVRFHHQDWHTLEMASQHLINLVEYIIKIQNSSYGFDEFDEPLPNPLVRYYGQGFIMQTSAHIFRKRLTEAEELIKNYQDLSWFPDLDEAGLIQVERFKMFAKANTFYFQLEKGNLSIIPEYMSYLKDFDDDELLPAVRQIIEVANRFKKSLSKEVIDKAFELIILRSDLTNHDSYYAKEKLVSEYIQLIYALAKYLFRLKNYQKGMDMALKCLEVSISFKNNDIITKSISLIEYRKDTAEKHQMEDYAKIRERMIDYEEVC